MRLVAVDAITCVYGGFSSRSSHTRWKPRALGSPNTLKELDSISVICPLLESLWLGALAFSSSLRRYVFCVTTEVPHLDSLLCGIKRRGCSLDSGVAAVRHVWCLSALCPPGNPTQSFPYFFTEPVFKLCAYVLAYRSSL